MHPPGRCALAPLSFTSAERLRNLVAALRAVEFDSVRSRKGSLCNCHAARPLLLARLLGEPAAAQLQEEDMLYQIKANNVKFAYEKGSFSINAYLTFELKNESTLDINGLKFTVQFKDRATGQYHNKTQRTWSDNDSLKPGQTRAITQTLSNCPNLGNVPISQYITRLEPIFSIDNAIKIDGELFRRPPNLSLESKIKDLKEEVENLEKVLEKSKDRKKFTFWEIFSYSAVNP